MKFLLLFLLSLNTQAGIVDCVKNLTFTLEGHNCNEADYWSIVNNQKEIAKGDRAIAAMRHLNKQKNLTVAQKKLYMGTVKDIVSALKSGSLDVAKDLANEISPDGTVITNEDKAMILQMLE